MDSDRGRPLPFWPFALLAAAGVFALVVAVGLLLVRGLRPSPGGRQAFPDSAALERFLAEYFAEQGPFREKTALPTRPVSPATQPAAATRPVPVTQPTISSRPAGASRPAQPFVTLAVERIPVGEASLPPGTTVVRLLVVNTGRGVARGVVLEVFAGLRGPRLAGPFALGDLPAGGRRELITTIEAGRSGLLLFRARFTPSDGGPPGEARCLFPL